MSFMDVIQWFKSYELAIRTVCTCRYAVFLGAFLCLGGLVFLWKKKPNSLLNRLFGNLFYLNTFWQHLTVAVIVTMGGWLVISTYYVSAYAGRARFYPAFHENVHESLNDLLKDASERRAPHTAALPLGEARIWQWWVWLWLLALSLPIPLACWIRANNKLTAFGGVAAGFAFAVIVLILFSILNHALIPATARLPGFFPVDSGSISREGDVYEIVKLVVDHLAYQTATVPHKDDKVRVWPGYGFILPAEDGGRSTTLVVPGHLEMSLTVLTLLCFYAASYFPVKLLKTYTFEQPWFPTLFYVVLIGMLTTTCFSAVAFFLDYYMVPVLPMVLIVFVATRWGTDHYYVLNEIEEPSTSDPTQILDVRTRRAPKTHSDKELLTVITAPGGGVHAAAWTAEVLCSLSHRYPRFQDSIALISAVSGGSVGTMFWLASCLQPNCDENVREKVREAAMAPSLDAIAWGFAFPDLMRLSLPDWLARKFQSLEFDRGKVLEEFWTKQLEKVASRDEQFDFVTLKRRIEDGELPSFVFNATIVETGQRFLISPVRIHQETGRECKELVNVYSNANLHLTTAARLSSTFPYVTPTCCPLNRRGGYHVCDGGYADNEGIVTAVEWLRSQDLSKYNVVFLRIVHGPEPPQGTDALSGWVNTLFGPPMALASVQTTSQSERASLELQMLQEAKDTLTVVELKFEAPSGCVIPLSWKLTREQQEEYKAAWRRVEDSSRLEKLDNLFAQGRRSPDCTPSPNKT